MSAWLGESIRVEPEAAGVAELVDQWLRAFGPGTLTDIEWSLGQTTSAVRKALVQLQAVKVDLGGDVGYLLPEDVERPDPIEPWAAVLPPLDPTTMGWSDRGFYLGAYAELLVDSTGNAGPTLWWEGRVVGTWLQDKSGEVLLQVLEDIGAEGQCPLETQAARLTEWLGGTRVLPRFPTPLSRATAAG